MRVDENVVLLLVVGGLAALAWFLGGSMGNPLVGQGGILQTPLSAPTLGRPSPAANPDALSFSPPASTAAYAAWMTNPYGPQYGAWLNPVEQVRTR